MSPRPALSAGCAAELYNIPTTAPACAVPSNPAYISALATCCNGAPITSYDSNCGLYCVANGQSVQELVSCLFSHGVSWADGFCNAQMTASATVVVAAQATGGTGVAGTATSSAAIAAGTTGTATAGAGSQSVAAGLRSEQGVSVRMLGIVTIVVGAVAFGGWLV